MTGEGSRVYPDEASGPFPVPPATIADREDRTVDLVASAVPDDEQVDALTRMYLLFDPTDRAQGIPPTGETRVREWLGPILDDGINVFATVSDEAGLIEREGGKDTEDLPEADETVVGHATLVPDADDPDVVENPADIEWELAIFVLQSYQGAGIGTDVLEHLLGHASEVGVDRVWLTVERWNGPAIALYEHVGFEICGAESFEQEMSIRLA